MMRLGIEFPAQLIGMAGSGHRDLLLAKPDPGNGEIAELIRQALRACSFKDLQRIRPLNLADEDIRVADRHIQPRGIGPRPAVKIAIGLRIPETVRLQTQKDA